MKERVRKLIPLLENFAKEEFGLSFNPTDYEFVPHETLMSVSSGPFPIRFHHWTYGRDYYLLSIYNRMGLSHLYESFFYGNPSYAFIKENEKYTDQILIIAHCIGHSDFVSNNLLFSYNTKNLIEIAIEHAEIIARYEGLYGEEEVEELLDALFSVANYVDISKPLRRKPYPPKRKILKKPKKGEYSDLLGEVEEERWVEINREVPPYDEHDILFFIYLYSDLPNWKKEVIGIFREEMYYLAPIIRTKIMNEGWASFIEWELIKKLDEKEKIFTDEEFVRMLRTHSMITGVMPSPFVSPYALGYAIWKKIYDKEKAFAPLLEIRKEYDDLGFVRDFLDENVIEELGLFEYQRKSAITTVTSKDSKKVKKRLLELMSHSYSPNVFIEKGGYEEEKGTVKMRFVKDTEMDLDLTHAEHVILYLHKLLKKKIEWTIEKGGGAKPFKLIATEGRVIRKIEG